jgi:hypothetical protein
MRFAESFISGLVNPQFGPGMLSAGQAMGAFSQGNDPESIARREAEAAAIAAQQQEAMKQQNATALAQEQSRLRIAEEAAKRQMTAEQTAPQQEALAKFLEARDETDLAALARNGVVDASNYKTFLEKPSLAEQYVPVGKNVFNRVTGQFITQPTQEQVDSITVKQAADLQKTFTPESVQAFIKNSESPLILREDGKKTAEDTPEAAEESRMKLVGQLAATDSLMDKIKQAKTVAADTRLATYPLEKMLPLTNARNLSGLVDTIRANLAFDRLQKMRDESKTGGALGQVSNIELQLLESAVASLDPAAGNEVFQQRLDEVMEKYDAFKNALLGKLPNTRDYIEHNGRVYYFNPFTGETDDLGAME